MEDVAKIERDAACEGCGASTSRGIEQDAITAWNTRQPTQSNLHKTQSAPALDAHGLEIRSKNDD
jgi:hypothetical protein